MAASTRLQVRAMVMCLLCLLSAPSLVAARSYGLEATAVADGVWVVEGTTENFSPANGGNIVNTGFIETDAGVVVIDTGPSRRYGEALRALIARHSDQPVTHVLLTHHHPDHVFGNQAFPEHTLYMLPRGRELLARDGPAFAENMYRLVGDWMRGTELVVPPNTLSPGVLTVGTRRLRLMAFAGHTGSDLVVLDESSGVLFASDLVFYNRALTTPQTPGLARWAEELQQLRTLPFRVLVPGHGPVSDGDAALAQMADYLSWLDRALTQAARRGLSRSEVMQMAIPERFAAVAGRRYELIRTTTHLYPGYEKAALELLASPEATPGGQ